MNSPEPGMFDSSTPTSEESSPKSINSVQKLMFANGKTNGDVNSAHDINSYSVRKKASNSQTNR